MQMNEVGLGFLHIPAHLPGNALFPKIRTKPLHCRGKETIGNFPDAIVHSRLLGDGFSQIWPAMPLYHTLYYRRIF